MGDSAPAETQISRVKKTLCDIRKMLQDNTRRTDGVAQFQRAILQQDNRLLRFIFDQNAVDLKKVDVNEALCICCQQNNIEGVQILLSLKWPLNLQYKDPQGRRALHYAAAVGGVNIIELLLREGIPINIFDNNKDYPVHLAVYNGHIDVIKYLIRKGALVNNSRNQIGETILHSAVDRGQVDVVQALVEMSLVDVNVETGQGYRNAPSPRPAGYTALHIAVQKSFTDIVKLLCVNGANPNKCGADLKFPIHIAAENGDVEILKILLSAGANERVLEKMDNTPLHVAIYSKTPTQVQVVEMLAKLGTGINSFNSQGMAPLHIAACLSIPQVVEILLQNGSKISLQSRRKGETALVIAASTGHLETINLLLERGSDIRDRDTMGHAVLHKVLSTQRFGEKHVKALAALIEAGAELNVIDQHGYTPLHTCAFRAVLGDFSLKALKLLVGAGSYLSPQRTRDERFVRHSPLCLLVWHGHYEAADFLIRAGWDLREETWIYLPGKTDEQNRLHAEMQLRLRKPKLLSQACRDQIREFLCLLTEGKEIFSLIDQLPLPSRLKMDLKMLEL